jgi:hypothetical protein
VVLYYHISTNAVLDWLLHIDCVSAVFKTVAVDIYDNSN